MPCAADPNGTLTTLPLRSDSSKYGRVLVHDQSVAGAVDVVGGDRDQLALLSGLLWKVKPFTTSG